MRDKIIVGSPEQLADRLTLLRGAPRLDGILAEFDCGTRIPNDRIMNSLQLLCDGAGRSVVGVGGWEEACVVANLSATWRHRR